MKIISIFSVIFLFISSSAFGITAEEVEANLKKYRQKKTERHADVNQCDIKNFAMSLEADTDAYRYEFQGGSAGSAIARQSGGRMYACDSLPAFAQMLPPFTSIEWTKDKKQETVANEYINTLAEKGSMNLVNACHTVYLQSIGLTQKEMGIFTAVMLADFTDINANDINTETTRKNIKQYIGSRSSIGVHLGGQRLPIKGLYPFVIVDILKFRNSTFWHPVKENLFLAMISGDQKVLKALLKNYENILELVGYNQCF